MTTIAPDWATVIIAFFTVVVSPVLMWVLTARLNKKVHAVKESAEATLYQVKNDHPKNMRVEGDERHDEILSAITAVKEDVAAVKSDVSAVKEDARILRTDHSSIQKVMAGLLERMQTVEHPAARKPRASKVSEG